MPENKTVALITKARAAGLVPQLWEGMLHADPALPITEGSQLEDLFAMARADLGQIPERAEPTIEAYWDDVFETPKPKRRQTKTKAPKRRQKQTPARG